MASQICGRTLCGNLVPVQEGKGRPRKFCSEECRVRHYNDLARVSRGAVRGMLLTEESTVGVRNALVKIRRLLEGGGDRVETLQELRYVERVLGMVEE